MVPESKISCSTKKTVDQLKDVTLDPDEVVISFDVSSLYTNVLVNEAMVKLLTASIPVIFKHPRLVKRLSLHLQSFQLPTLFYQLMMAYINKLMAWPWDLNQHHHSQTSGCPNYMDDILRTIKAEMIETKLHAINGLHPNLKFTIDVEQEGRLPFLNICILHIDSHLHSTWYTKPTDTGLVMNFHALAPKCYKRSVVEGLVYRVYRACSHWKYSNASLGKAKDMLERNQYLPQFYHLIIKATIEKLIVPVVNFPDENEESKSKVMVYVSYRGHLTDIFVKKLKESGAPVQPIVTLRKLKTVMPSLKTTTKFESRSRIVYKITCPGCDTCYVDQT